MENTNNISRDNVPVCTPPKKGLLFYVLLFAFATLASVAIIVVAFRGYYRILKTYSILLTAAFALLTLIMLLVYLSTASKMRVEGDTLYVTSKLITRRIPLSSIEQVKVARFEDKDLTVVKISTKKKTYKYTYRALSKDSANKIRRILQ